ncbi:MAG TPA: Phenylacetic acid catabolic protein [Longimicrobiaceae bacterium]|nr:Phenylacetic acid catabolic protein [Longimicrobiaceae bacterium]
MSTPTTARDATIEKAAELPEEARNALRDLILALADSKRLLGIRYSDWMLAAPTIEAGIAASSMAQDEWGHGRLTYALLSDFGEEPKQLEHEREAAEYRSIELLDRPLRSWSELIAVSLLLDSALTVQYGALIESRYTPVHNRVQKLLDEEHFHFQYAAGWTRRMARVESLREELQREVDRLLPAILRWFGQEGGSTRRLVEEGLVREGPDELRARFLARVAPVLVQAGLTGALGQQPDGEWSYDGDLSWTGWDERTRRAERGGPDAETLARVRGDKNRALLLD